ncbi:MAG TPA: hypothetical protein VKZ98_08225 [Aquaticitalea sp.]|nr:hypothetical protein [Aquaticitalea sp.]
MKKLIVFLTILSTLAFTTTAIVQNTNISVAPESELLIKGTTNVNSFKCVFNIKEVDKAIPIYYKVTNDRIEFEKANLILDNNCFDCGNKGMNRDFMALLKSDEYPEIVLELKELKNVDNTTSNMNAKVKLTLAGISKNYMVSLKAKDNEPMEVSGNLRLNITDFGLEAPKKALGLIVVSENIEIKFQLILKESKP